MTVTGAGMRTGLVLELLSVLALLGGCMSDGDFAVRLAIVSDRTDADAAAAHGCAEELRAVADRDPFVTGTALDMQNGMGRAFATPPMPPSAVARRAREELARREGAIEGARRAIRSARAVGPVALATAIEAGRLARGARDRLCQARDVATTIAAMTGPRRTDGMITAVK